MMERSCHGLVPLSSRRFPLLDAVATNSEDPAALLERFGSPLNLIDPGPMATNHAELAAAAISVSVDLRVYFARKANKTISLMRRALELGLGIDVASERELQQALRAGASGDDVIVTAAVKPDALLALAVDAGAVVAIDHEQEAERWAAFAERSGTTARVALRLAIPLPGRPASRFGLTHAQALAVAALPGLRGRVAGLHFHLDGYAAEDRVSGLHAAISLSDELGALGHRVAFIDIGGGIPMRYVDDAAAWEEFWRQHRAALSDPAAPPLTFGRHGLGLVPTGDGGLVGAPAVYPVAQQLIRGAWLASILAAPGPGGESVAAALRERGLQLRCEPGRALLDGCGVTLARVLFTKPAQDGRLLAGLEMNRTQLRSAADDFLVDPLLLTRGGSPRPGAADGHLVGAYCIERELITWRTLRFPHGIAPGDVIAFPNTAGYLMHILESASHQLPLAANLIVDPQDLRGASRDAIDAISPLRG